MTLTNSISPQMAPDHNFERTLFKGLSVFIMYLVGTALLCLGGYALTVDRLIDRSALPATYKWFLLKEVPGPRIIFESGSNSHHAIDTDAIGVALGRTAINIADNGGYALEDKITRLETYARPGDIIVLPFEWNYYHREKLTDDYVNSLFNSNFDYYRSMPMEKRVKRALSLPPATVFSNLLSQETAADRSKESPAQNLFISALTQPTGHQSRATSTGPGVGVAEQSCDDYILGKDSARRSLTLGKNIRPALARLQKLKSRGINIHFAWPVMAGEGCLTSYQYVDRFRTDIEKAVRSEGFEFLGTPSQSLYGQDYQDDTPYHIISAATDIHTLQMISFLKAQGYGAGGSPLNITEFARHRLFELELAEVTPLKQRPLELGKVLSMDDAEAHRQVEFSAGWWGFEPFGRWMRDNRAMLRVTLPSDLPANTSLNIQGITKSGQPERVNLSVNGRLIGSGMFGESASLSVPVADLPSGEALSIFVELTQGEQPQSPKDLHENEDARSMTLHFQKIELKTASESPKTYPPKSTESAAIQPDLTTQITPAAFQDRPYEVASTAKVSLLKPENFSEIQPTIQYGDGWWAQESEGRWMRSEEASFNVQLPQSVSLASSKRYTLELTGAFFSDRPQSVDVIIDGQNTVTVEVTETGVGSFSFESSRPAVDVNVTLRFPVLNLQSPKDLGLSRTDERTLTFFLKSMKLRSA